jgi:hypothetical protein
VGEVKSAGRAGGMKIRSYAVWRNDNGADGVSNEYVPDNR